MRLSLARHVSHLFQFLAQTLHECEHDSGFYHYVRQMSPSTARIFNVDTRIRAALAGSRKWCTRALHALGFNGDVHGDDARSSKHVVGVNVALFHRFASILVGEVLGLSRLVLGYRKAFVIYL